jgi:hypothetical protein
LTQRIGEEEMEGLKEGEIEVKSLSYKERDLKKVYFRNLN